MTSLDKGRTLEPTKKQCEEWVKSIKHLLEDEEGYLLFFMFLEQREQLADKRQGEFTRYLEFWAKCKEHKKSDLSFLDKKQSALNIFDTFLVSQGKKRIKLAGHASKTINEQREDIEQLMVEHNSIINTYLVEAETRMLEKLGSDGCGGAYDEFCKDMMKRQKAIKENKQVDCRLI